MFLYADLENSVDPQQQFNEISQNQAIKNWLVVWSIWIIFPYIGKFIIPIDFNMFQRGLPTTNQKRIAKCL